jgi:predicted Zn-dependent protease
VSSLLEEIVDQIRHHSRLIIADDYEISIQRHQGQSRKYRNGEESVQSTEDRLWIGLRLAHRKAPGRSVTFSRSKAALDELVESAFHSARQSSPDPWFRFPLWKQIKAEPPKRLPFAPLDSLFPKLKVVPDVLDEVYDQWEISTLLNRKSERFPLAHLARVEAAHFSVLNHEDDSFFWVKEDRALPRSMEERPAWLAHCLQRSFRLKGSVADLSGNTGSLLMTPPVVAALVKTMLPWFYADRVHSGASPLHEARGTQIFSDAVNLIDDGSFSDAVETVPFDMEGSLPQVTQVVYQGVLKDLLFDVYAATRENRISTGNYLRPISSLEPKIGASTFYVKPSEEPASRLLSFMRNGVVVETVDAIEPIPATETEFTLKVSGWKAVRGEPAGALRELSFKIDLLQLFSRAVSVGNDLTFYGGVGSPSILFENVPLGAK